MLQVKPPKCSNISLQKLTDNIIYFTSEMLNIRINFVNKDIVRVTFTERNDYLKVTDDSIINCASTSALECKETDEMFVINGEAIDINVIKETGQIICKDKSGNVFYNEAPKKPHQLEAFEYMAGTPVSDDKIIVRKTPDGPKNRIKDGFKIYDKTMYTGKLSLALKDGEAIYGLGQDTNGLLNLRNSTKYLYQANLKISIPFMISNSGYGILINSASPMIFCDSRKETYFYVESVDEFDYFIIKGTPKEVIKGYRYLTGKASLPPMWAFGFIQSQERYETQDEILEIAKGYRDRKIGIDCIVQDFHSWDMKTPGQKEFDKERYPEPDKMLDNLHKNNIKFMLSVWPRMFNCPDGDEMNQRGHMLMNTDYYDALSQEARDIYKRQFLNGYYSHAIDAIWSDITEPMTYEWVGAIEQPQAKQYADYLDQTPYRLPLSQGNSYSLYHSKCIYDAIRSTNNDKRVVNLTRSSFTGEQRYGTILWSGDISANWDTLKLEIAEGLSFVASGQPWWNLDLGGFFVKPGAKWFWNGDYALGNDDLGYRELYVRFYQFGTFLPMFRSHGTDTYRQMWNFGDENDIFFKTLLKYNRLRYSLIPTIYSIAGNVWKNDDSFFKPLYFDFMYDDNCTDIKDQFMVGNDIMVCPVYKPMYYSKNNKKIAHSDKTRSVYFPKGYNWYDFENDKIYVGGTSSLVDCDIQKIPVFVKSGGIVITGESTQYAEEWLNKQVTINVYDGENGSFDWYLDKGDGYGYENNEYSLINISFNNADKTLTLAKREGSYKNMMQNIKLTVKFENGKSGSAQRNITYTGDKLTIKLI